MQISAQDYGLLATHQSYHAKSSGEKPERTWIDSRAHDHVVWKKRVFETKKCITVQCLLVMKWTLSRNMRRISKFSRMRCHVYSSWLACSRILGIRNIVIKTAGYGTLQFCR